MLSTFRGSNLVTLRKITKEKMFEKTRSSRKMEVETRFPPWPGEISFRGPEGLGRARGSVLVGPGTIRLIMLSAHLSTRPFIIPPPVHRYIDPLLTRVKLCRPLPSALSDPLCLWAPSKGRKEERHSLARGKQSGGDRANDRGSNIVSLERLATKTNVNRDIDRRKFRLFLLSPQFLFDPVDPRRYLVRMMTYSEYILARWVVR